MAGSPRVKEVNNRQESKQCLDPEAVDPQSGNRPPDLVVRRTHPVVELIRNGFGLSQDHAILMSSAAEGAPQSGEGGWSSRVRGVFPLPFLAGRSKSEKEVLRAGARRRLVDRQRHVSKTNLVIGLLNLLYGGLSCLQAGLVSRAGAAQLAATARVRRTVQSWDFRADSSAAAELAGRPIVGYSLGEELTKAVDTIPDQVKFGGTS